MGKRDNGGKFTDRGRDKSVIEGLSRIRVRGKCDLAFALSAPRKPLITDRTHEANTINPSSAPTSS